MLKKFRITWKATSKAQVFLISLPNLVESSVLKQYGSTVCKRKWERLALTTWQTQFKKWTKQGSISEGTLSIIRKSKYRLYCTGAHVNFREINEEIRNVQSKKYFLSYKLFECCNIWFDLLTKLDGLTVNVILLYLILESYCGKILINLFFII